MGVAAFANPAAASKAKVINERFTKILKVVYYRKLLYPQSGWKVTDSESAQMKERGSRRYRIDF